MPTVQSSSMNGNKVDKKIAKAAASVVGESEQLQAASVPAATAATGGNKTPQEQPEFIKQALIIIEKKVRNLEKRKVTCCLCFLQKK